MDVALVMFKSDGTRRDFPIAKSPVIVGRTNSCDLRIPLSSVSRQHCELRLEGQSIQLRDLGSSNGTFHNSTRIQETTVQAGDEILIGPVLFTVMVDGKPSEIKPVKTVVDSPGQDEPDQAEPAAAASKSEDQQPRAMVTSDDDDEILAALQEEDAHSPTVDLDDPIAALEAMADSEDNQSKDNAKN